MSKRDTRLTAENAAALADAFQEPAAEPPVTPVRKNVVLALVDQYLLTVGGKARGGGRRLRHHDIGVIPMRVSRGEKEAAFDELRKLGYTVDAEGVNW